MKKVKVLIPIIVLTTIIVISIILLNPNTRYKNLLVDENKWDSIIDSRSDSSNLQLEAIEFNEYSLAIDKASNTIYYSLVNNNKTKYNPNISFSANEDNVKLAILEDEITDEKVHSDYKFKLMIYNNSKYHIYNLVCTDFPIVNITYNGDKEKNIDVNVYVFDNMEKSQKRITNSKGILDIIKTDNKIEYKLNLIKNSPGRNKRENHISIFNMNPNNEYFLTQKENNNNSRNMKVELFINNEYQGQYNIF